MKWILPIVIFCATVIAACSRNGVAVEESRETTLFFRAVTVDSLRLGVKVDSGMVFNDFLAPSVASRSSLVKYYTDNKKRVVIYDMASNNVFFDSVFQLKRSTENITLYQKNAGESFSYVAPPEGEALPPEGYGKISMSYLFDGLPQEVKVVVQNSKTGGDEYVTTDSFLLKKGVFSSFFLGRNNSLRRPQVFLYTPDAVRKLLGTLDRGQFTSMNATYTIYVVTQSSFVVNGSYGLVQEKLY